MAKMATKVPLQQILLVPSRAKLIVEAALVASSAVVAPSLANLAPPLSSVTISRFYALSKPPKRLSKQTPKKDFESNLHKRLHHHLFGPTLRNMNK
ncbi:hypothetical protein U1Q18_033834 [Sarracenia purpurea var. burkii]